MTVLDIRIVAFVEEHQPNLVEARLRDAWGHKWRFIDKDVMFTSENLDEDSHYPLPGVIACQVISRKRDTRGREIVAVSTARPWVVEAVDGETQFDVLPHQLSELADS